MCISPWNVYRYGMLLNERTERKQSKSQPPRQAARNHSLFTTRRLLVCSTGPNPTQTVR